MAADCMAPGEKQRTILKRIRSNEELLADEDPIQVELLL